MEYLFENGTILTMEERMPAAQALLVRDGRIAAVGAREAVAAQASGDAERVDLAGRTVMPAFLDPHSHFFAVANGFLQVSLEGYASWADIAERIQSYIRDNHVPAGEWVRAQGYDHNALAEGRHPDRQVLDAAAPEHPVILQHQSGHMGVFNTLALERLGVTEKTPCPEGGAMGREGGALTGYMEENAFLLWQRKVPMPDLAALTAACEKAQALYASCGITTVQEGMLPEQLCTDEAAVAKAVEGAGYEPYEKRLLGITAMSQTLGRKKFEELLGGLVYKPPGKPVLVPESDKRPAMNTAINDFKENEEDNNYGKDRK